MITIELQTYSEMLSLILKNSQWLGTVTADRTIDNDLSITNQDYAKEIELKYSMFKNTQNRYRQLAVERISEVFPGKSSLSKIERHSIQRY